MARTIVIGKLYWSEDGEYCIETDEGGFWILELPKLLIEPVDRLLFSRVVVEGGSTGHATIFVSAVIEA